MVYRDEWDIVPRPHLSCDVSADGCLVGEDHVRRDRARQGLQLTVNNGPAHPHLGVWDAIHELPVGAGMVHGPSRVVSGEAFPVLRRRAVGPITKEPPGPTARTRMSDETGNPRGGRYDTNIVSGPPQPLRLKESPDSDQRIGRARELGCEDENAQGAKRWSGGGQTGIVARPSAPRVGARRPDPGLGWGSRRSQRATGRGRASQTCASDQRCGPTAAAMARKNPSTSSSRLHDSRRINDARPMACRRGASAINRANARAACSASA